MSGRRLIGRRKKSLDSAVFSFFSGSYFSSLVKMTSSQKGCLRSPWQASSCIKCLLARNVPSPQERVNGRFLFSFPYGKTFLPLLKKSVVVSLEPRKKGWAPAPPPFGEHG